MLLQAITLTLTHSEYQVSMWYYYRVIYVHFVMGNGDYCLRNVWKQFLRKSSVFSHEIYATKKKNVFGCEYNKTVNLLVKLWHLQHVHAFVQIIEWDGSVLNHWFCLFVCLFVQKIIHIGARANPFANQRRNRGNSMNFYFYFFFLFVLCWQFIAHTKVSVWTFATATAAEENSTNHTPLKMAAHKCVLLAHSILMCVCVCVQSRVLTKRGARCVMHSENNNFSIAFIFIVYIVQCTNVCILSTHVHIHYILKWLEKNVQRLVDWSYVIVTTL